MSTWRRDYEIRRRRKNGDLLRDIADDYGLSGERIRQICSDIPTPTKPKQICQCGSKLSRGSQKCRGCYNAARLASPLHGTRNTYQYHGCRCARCVEAINEHKRSLQGQPAPSHGVSGYVNYGCRCEVCKAAGSENNRRQRERRIQKLQSS